MPEASSPAAFVVPAGHATQAFAETRWFAAQIVASHDDDWIMGSRSGFVVPGGQDWQSRNPPYSFSRQNPAAITSG